MNCPQCEAESIDGGNNLKCSICFGIWRYINDNITLELLIIDKEHDINPTIDKLGSQIDIP
jgi:hypothetical protein